MEPREYADVGAVPGLPVYQKTPSASPARAAETHMRAAAREVKREEEPGRRSMAEVETLLPASFTHPRLPDENAEQQNL